MCLFLVEQAEHRDSKVCNREFDDDYRSVWSPFIIRVALCQYNVRTSTAPQHPADMQKAKQHTAQLHEIVRTSDLRIRAFREPNSRQAVTVETMHAGPYRPLLKLCLRRHAANAIATTIAELL